MEATLKPKDPDSLRKRLLSQFEDAHGSRDTFMEYYFKGFNEDERAVNASFKCMELHNKFLVPYFLATVLNAEGYKKVRERLLTEFRAEAITKPYMNRTVTLQDVQDVEDALHRYISAFLYNTAEKAANEEHGPSHGSSGMILVAC